jgi:hypothetical protein
MFDSSRRLKLDSNFPVMIALKGPRDNPQRNGRRGEGE